MSASTFMLENHRELFRDEASFDHFVEAVKAASSTDLALIFARHEIIGAVLSPQAAKQVLCERMVHSIAKNPELLSEIEDRLVNERIVD